MDTSIVILLVALGLVFIPIIYVCMKSANRSEQLREQGLEYSKFFKYEGGLDGRLAEDLSNLEIFPDHIRLILGKNIEKFDYSQIEKVKIMTKSQMESYISAGRVAMFGVLSLAMKKQKDVDRFFVIIELNDEQSIVLSTNYRNQCEKTYEYLNKNLQRCRLSN